MSPRKKSQIPAGQLLGHYRVRQALGAGGMGEVFLAEDIKLDRLVALKLLPKEVAEDGPRRKRFLDEAKAASALNHPNVCTIYEVGETAEGQPFIAMEYLEGQTLGALAQQRRLQLREIVGIGLQVAGALEEAWRHHVVHRDIKPGNIMVDAQGHVKVLDFGLAKRLDRTRETTSAQTQEGAIVGTPNYLSPELVLGKEVDHRTDIFSLGVVLYELAAGKTPFGGASFGETVNQILNREPEPLQPWNPTVTAEFERVVLKCLEKDPGKRYATPGQLREDLAKVQESLQGASRISTRGAWAVATAVTVVVIGLAAAWLMRSKPATQPSAPVTKAVAPASRKSVAVLPFVNMSAEKTDEYLSDGLTEELLNALTKVKGLRVPARTSCFVFKGKTEDIRKIGEQLSVGTVLEGSVRKSGNQLRISAQLVNVADGFHLWSDTYDRDMTNIFAIQSDIAARVAEALKVELLGAAPEPTASIDAYKLYLQGRYLWNRRTAADIRQSIGCFNQAIVVDSNYALAYAGLADAYVVLPNYDIKPSSLEAEARARAAALKALELQPRLAAAVATLACCKSDYDWDWQGAEAGYRLALELDPNYPTARQWYAELLSTLGRSEEALREAGKALELDPLSPVIQTVYGRALIAAGRIEEAIPVLRKQLASDPSLAPSHTHLGYAYVSQGRLSEAIVEYEAASRLNGWPLGDLGFCYGKAGRSDNAKRVLQQLLELQTQGAEVSADMALVYHGLGDESQAFEALEKAVGEHPPYLAYYVRGNFWKDVRSHPRFQAVLKKMNLVE